MLGQTVALGKVLHLLLRLGLVLKHFHFRHAIQAIVGNIAVFIIIAKQIISTLICHHLIRTYNVRLFPLGVQLEVLAIAVINEADFPPLLDGIVQHIQIQQDLLVV